MRRTIVPILAFLAAAAAAPALAQKSGEPFRWSGDIQRDRWVYVHNVNGAVRVEPGTGSTVEVTATKKWRRGNPDDVKITVEQVGSGKGDILICARWNEKASCDADGVHSGRDSWLRGGKDNDTAVEFTVRVPAGVRVHATSVNGSV